jgi:hypothetical protein
MRDLLYADRAGHLEELFGAVADPVLWNEELKSGANSSAANAPESDFS